jgi:SpoVK/Ycf46/Vps4 family AAA+-type ATPase
MHERGDFHVHPSIPSFFQNPARRLFFLHGQVQDYFYTPQLRELPLEQWLLEHLRSLGYSRIVFYGPRLKIHFLDEQTARLCQPGGPKHSPAPQGSGTPRGSRLRSRAPMGAFRLHAPGRTENQTAPSPPAQEPRTAPEGREELRWDYGAMNDAGAISTLSAWMVAGDTQTAVIFRNGEDILTYLDDDALRHWDDRLSQWERLPPGNRNIAIFIFKDHLDTSNRLPRLRKMMFLHQDNPVINPARVLQIGPPRADEVSNFLHRQRLTGNLPWSPLHIARSALPLARSLFPESLNMPCGIMADVAHQVRGWIAQGRGIPRENKAWDRLRRLKGLEHVEGSLRRLVNLVRHEQNRHGRQAAAPPADPLFLSRLVPVDARPALHSSVNLHMALMGNPGTGKTTVAEIIAAVYREEGVLEQGHLVKVTRKDLVEEHIGGTAKRTAEAITRAMGGVLFIDEAYQLSEGQSDGDFGREAVETLLEAMSHSRGRFAVIIAGYPQRIADFIEGPNANPGLARRFPRQNRWTLHDYAPEVLLSIFEDQLATKDLRADTVLAELLPDAFIQWHRARNPETFGNAGDVMELVETLQGIAVAEGRETIMVEDFSAEQSLVETGWPAFLKQSSVPDMSTLMASLDGLIGLAQVKEQLRRMAATLAVRQKRGLVGGIAPGHYVFSGNPGTGKTTVARLMGKILRNLGILRRGHVLEVRREDLTGLYMGHTEANTRDVLRRALDGVLFIDEAYQLIQGEQDSYGKTALETLLAFMEEHRDRLCVIIAGYPDLMRGLIASNPGFKSRFNNWIVFEDFSSDELLQIARLMLDKEQAPLGHGAEQALAELLRRLHARRDADFGNGREVRSLVDTIIANKDLRLFQHIDQATAQDLQTIEETDILPLLDTNS